MGYCFVAVGLLSCMLLSLDTSTHIVRKVFWWKQLCQEWHFRLLLLSSSRKNKILDYKHSKKRKENSNRVVIIWLHVAPWATRWVKCCAVIGYLSEQDGPILPAWEYPLCPLILFWLSLFSQDGWILTSFVWVYGPRFGPGPPINEPTPGRNRLARLGKMIYRFNQALKQSSWSRWR